MKKILFLLAISCSAFLVKAQKYEDIKNKLIFDKYRETKQELDNAMSNAKFAGKAEAYMLKTTIYAGLAMDSAVSRTPEAYQLTVDGEAAFAKYLEMDPAMTLITDPIYRNGPINLYNSWFVIAAKDYDAKKWPGAYEKFTKSLAISDLLIEKKVLSITLDTTIIYFTAASAENSGKSDDAAKIYTRITDAKINKDWAETAYRFLVRYYFGKNDIPSFEKYRALGKELYPKSEYFNYDKVDFAVGLQEKLDDKIKAVETVLAADPTNFKANEMLGDVIFEALNPREDTVQVPANADELEKKMVIAYNKTASYKANYEVPYINIGDHFINKAVKVNKAREDHAADMRARTKPGTMASKEDIAKRDMLDKKYSEELEQARDPYEKAAAIFAARTPLTPKEKQQYKKAASYLADIYANKKIQAKGKPADQAKYAAEEKKWNDLWDIIK